MHGGFHRPMHPVPYTEAVELLNEAMLTSHPLHDQFDWSTGTTGTDAHQRRINQARRILHQMYQDVRNDIQKGR